MKMMDNSVNSSLTGFSCTLRSPWARKTSSIIPGSAQGSSQTFGSDHQNNIKIVDGKCSAYYSDTGQLPLALSMNSELLRFENLA